MTAAAAEAPVRPVLLAAEPQLFTADLAASCRFYTAKLGFKVAFVHGEPPFYGQLVRDGARLNLRHVDAPVFERAFRAEVRDALSATITLEDIEGLFSEYRSAGVAFHQMLKTEPWGARTFIVMDPDGNLILFAGAA